MIISGRYLIRSQLLYPVELLVLVNYFKYLHGILGDF